MNNNYEDNEKIAKEQDKNGNDNEDEQDRDEVNDVKNEEESDDQAELETIPCSNKKSLILTASKDAHYNLAKQAMRMKTSDHVHYTSEFDGYTEKFIRLEEIPNMTITLRTTAKKFPVGTGQGYS
ncbi:hypothetical protein ABEB36_010591 [Hypothenemus hampei]|uniref:Uncharacterized protein n=1 Tax=Hypothenemus hampei TaxID=57062 RepID=A0ABD1ECJ6_HYPHA